VVFKFPRSGGGIDIYSSEIAALNLVETLPGEVRTQRLRSRDPYGQYVSYYGLEGVQLVSLYDTLDSAEKQHIGRKIGMFLSQLHELDLDGVQQITADDEVAEFQEKYHLLQPEIEEAFTPEERSLIAKLFMEIMPAEVAALGEDSCLSHGDLTPENIIIGSDGSVGVIDFSNVGYYDRSRDFIDIGDDTVRDAALEAYGADDLLRRKIAIRKIAQTAIDWAYYIHKHDVRGVARTIDQLRLGIQQLFHN
jgi:aminoglycoside phosphotransferase (APT) family kinase protein